MASFDTFNREGFLHHLREGMRRGAACKALDVERDEVDDYIEEHPDFAADVQRAELIANEHVEEALYQAAISGNVTACQLWLEHRGDERWLKSGRGVPDPPPPDPDAPEPESLADQVDEGLRRLLPGS